MGTFLGHVMPGTFFVFFGLWWTYNIWDRYWQANKSCSRYHSTLTFPVRSDSQFPIEGVVIIVCMAIGIAGELYTGWRDGYLAEIGNGQHATMYLVFGVAAVADILRHAGLSLVPGLEYATAVLAFAAEGLLFATHGGTGTPPLEVEVHALLLTAVVGCAAATLLEMRYRQSVMAALSRAFFTLLQGSWFVQVGFILNTPAGMKKWDTGSFRQQKMATMMFVWHWVGVLLVMAALGYLLQRLSSRGCNQHGPGVTFSLQDVGTRTHLLASSDKDED